MSTFSVDETIPEVWERVFQGRRQYIACGPRDVLIIKSNESLSSPDIEHRKKGNLTEEDKEKLKRYDLPIEHWNDEVEILTTKLSRDNRFNIVSVIDNPNMTSKYVEERISFLFSLTRKPGVLIIYLGSGKKATGDWCFKDGYITFNKIMQLYNRYYIGKYLGIISDCSYSGYWVYQAMDFLDECKARPCLHSARRCGIFLNVITSCQSNEIPHSLLFVCRAFRNDKNSGLFILDFPNHLTENQNVSHCSNIKMICSADNLDSDCLLPKDYTFQNYEKAQRLFLVQCSSEWVILMIDQDDEAIYQISIGQANPFEFGEVVVAGIGDLPDDATKQRIDNMYPGHVLDWTMM